MTTIMASLKLQQRVLLCAHCQGKSQIKEDTCEHPLSARDSTVAKIPMRTICRGTQTQACTDISNTVAQAEAIKPDMNYTQHDTEF